MAKVHILKRVMGMGGSAAATYVAAGNADLRVGPGRKEGEELPVYKDVRPYAFGLGLAAVAFGGGESSMMTQVGNVVADAAGYSFVNTEALRHRGKKMISGARKNGVVADVPAGTTGR